MTTTHHRPRNRVAIAGTGSSGSSCGLGTPLSTDADFTLVLQPIAAGGYKLIAADSANVNNNSKSNSNSDFAVARYNLNCQLDTN